ncbi:uncharacterized protein LOC129238383 [Anastrepha obliqua]|uniref:uncharacterized protein LOC129238383 n=1 Tax=Anastrepha obliqua TaxID=95512 RepID=UPI002409C307|nr:uncharacterized protein LOC129238383 [Anastrepha obliqua]
MEDQENDSENKGNLKKSDKLMFYENNEILAETVGENGANIDGGQSDGGSEIEAEVVRKMADNEKAAQEAAMGEPQEEYESANADNGEGEANSDYKNMEADQVNAAEEIEANKATVPCDATFDVRVAEEKLNSVRIDWTHLADAEVYKIEKFHRRRGWEQVAWVGYAPTTIQNLAENFTYRLRIKAQRFCEARGVFEDYKMSPEFLVTTQSPLPTALCLHRAIKKGQQFLVKRILRRRPSLLEYPGSNGYLPLANAIISGQNSVIDVLLSLGASVHVGNSLNARTPLQLAFYHGRLAVARILLNRKAQLEAVDINDMTACHFAVDANQLELLRFGLENGANVNAADACGWSLLSRAVVMGADVCVLKLLLLHGADAKSMDKLGKTCVDLAQIYKNSVAADYLTKVLRPK